VDALIAVPLGFGLGFLIGLTGIGGGALVAPTLYVLLGLPYGEAVGLSLIYSLLTKLTSGVQHVRQGTVLWPITLWFGVAGVPGALLGSYLVHLAAPAQGRALPMVMGVVLLLVSALLLAETAVAGVAAREKPFSPRQIGAVQGTAIALIQLVVGILLGLTSVGAGSIVILAMLVLFRMSAREVVGSSIVVALIMAVPAALAHGLAAGVRWRLLGLLLAGSLGGAVLGSRATLRVPERALKLAIVALIVAGAVATMVKAG
jgi:uncharacterized membrane protein YfcA